MTTEKPFHERHQINLAAALRQCPHVDADDIELLLEAAKLDLQAWTHHVASEWAKTHDLVERRAA